MKSASKKKKNVKIVNLQGGLDIYSTPPVSREIYNLISDNPGYHLILNLKDVDYISSSGIGFFIATDKILKNGNRKLILCNMNREVRKVFDMVCVTGMFDIADTEKDAMNMLKNL